MILLIPFALGNQIHLIIIVKTVLIRFVDHGMNQPFFFIKTQCFAGDVQQTADIFLRIKFFYFLFDLVPTTTIIMKL